MQSLSRGILSISSDLAAFKDPTRGEMVAALGELTGISSLERIRHQMLLDQTGRRILRERPLISSATLDLDKLSRLPSGTFGREYSDFLKENRVSPDSRTPVISLFLMVFNWILTVDRI